MDDKDTFQMIRKDITERLRDRDNHDCIEAANEIERLREDQEDTHALIERTGAILTATANALHGGYAPPDCLHSWHDLPELVEQLRKERDEARQRYCFAMAEHGEEAEARQNAKDEGWDCLKENTND